MEIEKKFNFYRLKIWHKAHQLTIDVYNETKKFPKHEQYGITSQLRRSASSVPANIVEGYSRKSKKEFIQYLYQARSSLDETVYFLILSHDLGYISDKKFNNLIEDSYNLMKMMNSFISKVKSNVKS
jgi:four helix bundle protein